MKLLQNYDFQKLANKGNLADLTVTRLGRRKSTMLKLTGKPQQMLR